MKKIIRLTESELHNIIRNSVKRAINEIGYVSNDGNSMVGGYYDSWKESGTCNISTRIIDEFQDILMSNNLDEELVNEFADYVESNEDIFTLKADMGASYDESTGYGSSSHPVYEIDDLEGVENIEQYIKSYQGNPTIVKIGLEALNNVIDNIDSSDFDIVDNEDYDY